jgi:hypothetical protein
MKEAETPTFPVHPDLLQRLLAHDPGDDGEADPVVAHALSVCSAYAYASVVGFGDTPDTLARMMARLGLPSNRVLMVAERIDAAFIVANGFLLQSEDGSAAILAYRGTEPFNIANWMTDADLHNTPVSIEVGDEYYDVHPGFYRNVRSIRSPLIAALAQALEGRSIIDGSPLPRRLEALHLTGHSLGAAMAALTGLLLIEDPNYAALGSLLRSCYGFGQPMIGSSSLAEAMASSGADQRFLRFIYNNDVVPGLPPRGLGDYAHFGPQYEVAGDGGYERVERVQRQSSFLAIPLAPLQFVSNRLPLLRRIPFPYSLDDHLPLNYVEWLAPEGAVSEFGGYPARYTE